MCSGAPGSRVRSIRILSNVGAVGVAAYFDALQRQKPAASGTRRMLVETPDRNDRSLCPSRRLSSFRSSADLDFPATLLRAGRRAALAVARQVGAALEQLRAGPGARADFPREMWSAAIDSVHANAAKGRSRRGREAKCPGCAVVSEMKDQAAKCSTMLLLASCPARGERRRGGLQCRRWPTPKPSPQADDFAAKVDATSSGPVWANDKATTERPSRPQSRCMPIGAAAQDAKSLLPQRPEASHVPAARFGFRSARRGQSEPVLCNRPHSLAVGVGCRACAVCMQALPQQAQTAFTTSGPGVFRCSAARHDATIILREGNAESIAFDRPIRNVAGSCFTARVRPPEGIRWQLVTM